MAEKIGMISLGCPKNQVDAEVMLKKLEDAGYEITAAESEAEVIIVNTCGFIEDAKAEAIENIIEVAKHKEENLKALIVTGCLAERYRDMVSNEIPEVDVVVGIGRNGDIVEIVKTALEGKKQNYYAEKEALEISGERKLTTPPYTAYLKIAEGCDNCCSYCAIPMIRGKFRSREMADILAEANALAQSGVSEIILVAQDTTRYGEDLNGGKSLLPKLLLEIAKIEKIHWIRTLYTYPERISDELLDAMNSSEKIVPYLDIPIQHSEAEILEKMNRSGNAETLGELFQKIRKKVPDITLRTTLITGFPGETEENFANLCEFVKKTRFNHLGCFPYSEEEDTPAADFEPKIDVQVRQDRAENIMELQLRIVEEFQMGEIGKKREVLVEGYDDYIKCYFGRTAAHAPEIDGKIFFIATRPLKLGEYVEVVVNDTLDYDLLGAMEEN